MKVNDSERIQKANLIKNPLEELLPKKLTNFSKNGVKIRLESRKSSDLNTELKEWCFKLLEENMKKIYEGSKSGWNETEKREEMFEEKAYYLLAFDCTTNKPVGYCHFRFDMDFDNEVVYCYELQIDSQTRKVGLGKFMMEILEELCQQLELEKVMLTCSKMNHVGQKFFKDKMEYELDETDMNDEDPNVDYCIYSKVFWEDEEED